MSKPAPHGAWITAACIVVALLITNGALHGVAPFAVSVLLGLAVGEVLRLRQRVASLEARMQALENADGLPPTVTSYTQPETAKLVPSPAAPPPPVSPPVAQSAAPTASQDLWDSGPPAGSVRPPARESAPSPPQPPTLIDRWLAAALGWLRGGNPVARAGVVILFFGGSFLAKYAAEHSRFPIEARMAALGLGALALLGIGWRLRRKNGLYAQTLQGGGIAGFYLTVFASTRLYQLLPQSLALSLMIVVAGVGAVLAVTQDALALAVLGTGGGFLAPILLSTGGGSLVALFSYYTVLNLGVFAVAWFRAWRVLNLLGFVFTFGVAGLFRALSYTADQRLTMDGFLLLFFVMYVAVSVLFSLRQKPDLKGYVSGSLVFGLPLVTFGLHASLVSQIELAMAWSALGFSLFYMALAAVLRASRIDNLSLLTEAFAALGVIFGSLAIPLGFDEATTAMMWAVEGAGLVWIGMRQQRRTALAFGLLLQFGGAISYLIGPALSHAERPLVNALFVGSTLLGGSGLLSGWWLFRARPARGAALPWDAMLAIWGLVWWLGGGLAEIDRFLPQYRLGTALLVAAITAAALLWVAQWKLWPALVRIASALLPLAALLGLIDATRLMHPCEQLGWAGWAALLIASWAMLHRLDREDAYRPRFGIPLLHAGAVWLLVLLVAWECSRQITWHSDGVWSALPWGLAPAIAGWLVSRPALRSCWPISGHAAAYRLLAAAPLAAFAALWTALINLTSDGDASGLRYVALLNPQDVAVALVFAAVALYWQALDRDERRALTPADARILPSLAAALVFLWLNAALLRALHHVAGAPLNLEGMRHSMLVQASLSIFWCLLAFGAMTLAARRAQRLVWIAGAGLMAVVVAKLFLIDTAGRGTLARIVSFLVVGLLLLVTGYLSPLPPRNTGDAADAEPGP